MQAIKINRSEGAASIDLFVNRFECPSRHRLENLLSERDFSFIFEKVFWRPESPIQRIIEFFTAKPDLSGPVSTGKSGPDRS